ncbi:MAG: DUF3782 domain-containing protein [Treponema sp.]|nr:DUF3782 domain-containing protein [Treponema sp.]
MGKTKTRKPQKGVTFEDVWASLKESNREWRERSEELDRQIKENALQMKETDRQMKETDRQMKETDRQMKETDRKISKLGNRFGQLIEHLAVSNIVEKFRALNYSFTRVSQNTIITDEQGQALAEIDLLLENGEYVMAVEVKSILTKTDVKDHKKRLEILRGYADKRNDKRIFAGAVAAALTNKNARDFALESGMYVVEQTGDTVRIKAPEKPYFW